MAKNFGLIEGDLVSLKKDDYMKMKIRRIYTLEGMKTAECECSTDWDFKGYFFMVKHFHLRDLKKKPLQKKTF